MSSLDTAGPARTVDGRVLDRVVLRGLRAVGHHGVLDAERRDGQPFAVDVALHLDTAEAAASDDLDATVDYGALAEELIAVLAGEPVALLETLADRLARACLTRSPRVAAVDVVVHKPRAPLTVPFDDVEVVVRRVNAPVVLSLGSNLGDRAQALDAAVAELRAADGLHVEAVSEAVASAPVGPVAEQPEFLNLVVLARTTLSPRQVLALCHEVERRGGLDRSAKVPGGPRRIDVDLVAHGDAVLDEPDLVLPHPRAHERTFVLAPWAGLDPGAVLPGRCGGPVREVLARLHGRAS